jgi:hypothetical protein
MGALNFWTKDRAALHGYSAVRESLERTHELVAELFSHHGIELRMPPVPSHVGDHAQLEVDLRESRGAKKKA